MPMCQCSMCITHSVFKPCGACGGTGFRPNLCTGYSASPCETCHGSGAVLRMPVLMEVGITKITAP